MKLTSKDRERFQKTLMRWDGRAIGFQSDQILLPNGKKAQREFMVHPGAVGVLAFTDDKKIVLVKQYRYPVREFTYEIPAGKLAKNEDPRKAMVRELSEETGYRAKRIKTLTHFWPTAAFSDEILYLYWAEGLTLADAHPDEDEFLEILTVTPKRMEEMIRTGLIRDSKTVIAYLSWKAFCSRTS